MVKYLKMDKYFKTQEKLKATMSIYSMMSKALYEQGSLELALRLLMDTFKEKHESLFINVDVSILQLLLLFSLLNFEDASIHFSNSIGTA